MAKKDLTILGFNTESFRAAKVNQGVCVCGGGCVCVLKEAIKKLLESSWSLYENRIRRENVTCS